MTAGPAPETAASEATASEPARRFAAPADLADPRLRRLILRLALPSMIGLSINALHHTINAVFVGMIDGPALAAVTLTFPLLILVSAVGEGLGVGTAAAIGRLLGAKEKGSAGTAASTAIVATLPIGIALSAILFLFRQPLLAAFGATPETLPLASLYLGIMAFGATLMLLQITCDFIAISEGNTRFSMLTLIAGFGINIVLDPILIFGFGMGVAGAAVATLASQCVALSAYAVYFAKGWGVVRVRARLARFSRAVVGPIVSIGLPTTLASAVMGFAYAFLYRAASEHGGADAIAGTGIALRLLTLGTLPVIGFALGAQAVLSFAWGARDLSRLSDALRFMLAASSGFALLFGIVAICFADSIAGLFTQDAAVRALAAQAIVLVHLPFPLIGARFVVLVLVQAMARPRLAALISLAPQGYLLVPALAVLPGLLGYAGIGASLAAAAGLTGIAALVLLGRIAGELRRPAEERRAVGNAAAMGVS